MGPTGREVARESQNWLPCGPRLRRLALAPGTARHLGETAYVTGHTKRSAREGADDDGALQESATVDEFIEHHSYDVSRGGIFIKTPSPSPARC